MHIKFEKRFYLIIDVITTDFPNNLMPKSDFKYNFA